MDKVDIVIARYNEGLHWLPMVQEKLSKKYILRVFIYNKGQDDLKGAIKLDNIGRESHTYLHHICTMYQEYKKEPCHIIFVQGSFWDHANTWYPGYDNEYYLLDAFVQDSIKHQGASLTWASRHEYLGNNAAKYDFHIMSHNNEKLHPLSPIVFGDWFVNNVKEPFPKYALLTWWIAALFCVHSTIITNSHDIMYYVSLMKQLDTVNPEIGHFFERSWLYITGANRIMQSIHQKSKTGHIL